MGAGCTGIVGHGNGDTVGGIGCSDGARRDGVSAVGISLGQRHVAGQVGTGNGEGLADSSTGGGAEAQRGGADGQRRGGGAAAGRLDTDYHLLIYVEVVAAVAEGVQRAPGVAVTAPTEVDVVLVGAAVVTVDVEGVATGVAAHGAEHDGTACCHLLLDQRCPLRVGVQGRAAAVGAGLLHEARGAGVVAEEGERVADVANAVHAHTATAGRARAVAHVLGLAHIAHQRGDSGALGGGVAARVAVQHVGPVERGRGQCRVGVARRAVARVADGRFVAGNGGGGCRRVLPEVEHHRGARGGAARQALVAAELALVVVRSLLVPVAGQQRAVGRGVQRRRLGSDVRRYALHARVLLQVHDLVLVLAQHVAHTQRQVVHVLQGTVTDHQDGVGTVITGDNQEGGRGVVDVVHGLVHFHVAQLSLEQNRSHGCGSHHLACIKLILKIVLCYLLSRCLVNRSGCQRHGH